MSKIAKFIREDQVWKLRLIKIKKINIDQPIWTKIEIDRIRKDQIWSGLDFWAEGLSGRGNFLKKE